jgi:hypothetical protein
MQPFLASRDHPRPPATTPDWVVGTHPFSVGVGDFAGDGMQDLAVANNGSSNVSVLLTHITP